MIIAILHQTIPMRKILILVGLISLALNNYAQEAAPMVSFEVIDSCEVHHEKLKATKVKPSKETGKSTPDHFNPSYPHATMPWWAHSESPSYQIQYVCKQCNKEAKKAKKARRKK